MKATNIDRAATAIIRAADKNPNITADSLQDELELGAIDGWMAIVTRHRLTFADWSAAMAKAIDFLSPDDYLDHDQARESFSRCY
jgi:hypothetical protein